MRAYSNQGPLTSTLEQLRKRVSDQQERRAPVETVKLHALKRRLTDADRAAIITAYEAGATANQLAADFRLGKGSILAILRNGGAAVREQRRLTEDEIDHAVTSYRNGESLAHIGQRLGVAHTTVRTALQRRGVARRDSHGRPR